MAFCDLQGPQQGAKIELSTAAGAIVIAGAGQAGGRAAEALRARGFHGKITMLGEEPHPPYERPQLSKDMLGAVDKPVSYIKQASDWTDVLDIQLETGSPVTHCDADRRTVATADGRVYAFDRLLIAQAMVEGILRKHMVVRDGGERDSAYYSVIDDEWPALRERLERRVEDHLTRRDRQPAERYRQLSELADAQGGWPVARSRRRAAALRRLDPIQVILGIGDAVTRISVSRSRF